MRVNDVARPALHGHIARVRYRQSTQARRAPEQVDVWDIHAAFAPQALGVLRELASQVDGFEVPEAVAIGHPLGSSGTRYS